MPQVARPVAERFWEKVDRRGPSDCWPWRASCNKYGYGFFALDHRQSIGAHRQAYLLTSGPIPDGMHVLHSCDNPPCVNPAHLRVGTHQENMRERNDKGRVKSPAWWSGANTKLNPEAASEIRRRFAAGGVSKAALGREFDVNETVIGKVIRQEIWRMN